jgi:hypothetical protein
MKIRLKIFLAIIGMSRYFTDSTPAAPLSDMRNPAGLSFNNTSHAFRKICAPWGVTFFMGLVHEDSNA